MFGLFIVGRRRRRCYCCCYLCDFLCAADKNTWRLELSIGIAGFSFSAHIATMLHLNGDKVCMKNYTFCNPSDQKNTLVCFPA